MEQLTEKEILEIIERYIMDKKSEKEILEAINKVMQYLEDLEVESDSIDNLLYELRAQLI